MDGTELLDEISRRIMKRTGTKSVRDSTLAQELGVTQSALRNYRSKELTSRNVVNLMDKFAKKAQRRLMDETLIPIVEFFSRRAAGPIPDLPISRSRTPPSSSAETRRSCAGSTSCAGSCAPVSAACWSSLAHR